LKPENGQRELNQVLAIQKCQNEEYIGIVTGNNLIRGEQRVKQIFIFKRQREDGKPDCFALEKRVIVKDMDIFKKVCMDFYFK